MKMTITRGQRHRWLCNDITGETTFEPVEQRAASRGLIEATKGAFSLAAALFRSTFCRRE